jgi:hypothetical protein
MRTGLSNLAIGRWIPVPFNQIAPKDSEGKPIITQAITDSDRNLITGALLKQCDGKDGLADGIISNPLGCDFDPASLACKDEKSESCLSPEKVSAIKKRRWEDRRRVVTSKCIRVFFTTPGLTPVAPSVEYSRPDQASLDPLQQRWTSMSKRKCCQISSHSWIPCLST